MWVLIVLLVHSSQQLPMQSKQACFAAAKELYNRQQISAVCIDRETGEAIHAQWIK